ncbi:MAG TPA: DinB family protein [Candidatus Angelobacter sp.]|nr:DinB family protein [Candidatus Angelobacter sp.]
MERAKNWPALLLVALSLQLVRAQAAPASSAPQPARGLSEEVLAYWSQIGHKLIDMAEDFPEDKYGFKPQKDQRSFGENIVHVADEDYRLLTAIKGAPMGPAGGKQLKSDDYKTKAAVVKLIKQVVADGEVLLKDQGEAGISRDTKYPYGNFMMHASTAWLDAIEHSGEHYGQLVVYYRVSGMVPPSSRPKK